MPPNERLTRRDLIDPALERAGWKISDSSRVRIEVSVDGMDPALWAALEVRLRSLGHTAGLSGDAVLPSGIADYVLYRENGEVLAVVEAKKSAINPALAQAQVEFYVREFEKRQGWKPFAFLTNGNDIYFLDLDRSPKRLVHGFFSRDDLENLLFMRRQGSSLSMTPINPAIVNRSYQHEAIRRTSEAFEAGKRRALIVMATGTGKTRTAMALTDVFMRANQARRVLFVADRDALVTQALEEGFQEHLPAEPATRLFSDNLSTSSRLYVATLQTLNNVLEQFTPAFFDLIIFDEVHRSIFNKYQRVLEYLDGRMIGLTATPANFIDRNTFQSFECEDAPTFYYSYAEAIQDGHLVDYVPYQARTRLEGLCGGLGLMVDYLIRELNLALQPD